jgi:hypothetical protein
MLPDHSVKYCAWQVAQVSGFNNSSRVKVVFLLASEQAAAHTTPSNSNGVYADRNIPIMSMNLAVRLVVAGTAPTSFVFA